MEERIISIEDGTIGGTNGEFGTPDADSGVPDGYYRDEDGYITVRKSNARRDRNTGRSEGTEGRAGKETKTPNDVLVTPKKTTKRTKAEPYTAEDMAQHAAALFAIIALLRGPHWSVEPETMEVFTDPLHTWMRAHSKKTLVDLAKFLIPINIGLGLIAVLKKPIETEIKLYHERHPKGAKHPTRQPVPGNGPTVEAVQHPTDGVTDSVTYIADGLAPGILQDIHDGAAGWS